MLAGVLGAAALLLGTAGLCSTMRRALRAIGQAVPGAPGTRLRAGEKALLLAFVAGAVAIVSTSAGVYFVHADITSGIGVAGAFVVAMLGSCACTQALLFGAALAAEFDARATRGASPHRVAPPAASLDEARARRNPAARPCGARPINGSNNPWTRSPVKILRFPDERVRRDRTS